MDSSQIKQQSQPPPPPTTTIPIETLECSIENLVKRWNRRQKWRTLFKSNQLTNTLAPWRTRLAIFLESTPIHVVVIFLLVVDLVLTTLELVSSSLSSCKPRRHERGEELYHFIGIAILVILFLKSLALAVSLGMGSFLKRPGYVVDGVVLVVAIVLEAFLERQGGGILVVVSLWRVVRVVESAFEISDEAIEVQIEVIVCQFEALRAENARLAEIIAEKDSVIEELEEQIEKREHVSQLFQTRGGSSEVKNM